MSQALCSAILRGRVGLVQELSEQGSSVDETGNFAYIKEWTPLQFAHGSVEKLLLDRGATLYSSNDPKTALHLAAECGSIGVVRLYSDRGASVDSMGCEPRNGEEIK